MARRTTSLVVALRARTQTLRGIDPLFSVFTKQATKTTTKKCSSARTQKAENKRKEPGGKAGETDRKVLKLGTAVGRALLGRGDKAVWQ